MQKKKYYTEELSASEPMRQSYAEGLQKAVQKMREDASRRKSNWITPQKMAENPEFYRKAYAEMLGIPTCRRVFGTGLPKVTELPAGEEENLQIIRLKAELAEDIYFTGLLFRPKKSSTPSPLVISQHGGGGSPELCADLIGPNNYNHMTRRVLERGATVFSPQLLLWNRTDHGKDSKIPLYATPYDRGKTDIDFRQTGISLVGYEIYAISRCLDYLFAHENVIPDRCGMLGLSYGGYYTLHTMAYETRIKAGYSAAIFNDRIRYNWQDMVWNGSAAKFLDAEVAGLCAPRKLWIEVGKEDPVFDYRTSSAPYAEAEPYFAAQGVPQNIHRNLWEGGHTLDDREDGIDFLFSELT